MFAVVVAIDGVCGAAGILLGTAHLGAVIAREVHAGAAYDFRLYSLGVLGVLLVIPGIVCVRHVRGLARRQPSAWRGALASSFVLLAATAPLIPLQPIAIPPAALSLLNVLSLAAARTHYRAHPQNQ